MPEYSGLIHAILVALAYCSIILYRRCYKDWCGLRLVPGFLFAAIPSTLFVTYVYYEIARMGLSVPVVKRYWIPVSIIAAAVAQYLANRALRPLFPNKAGVSQPMPLAILADAIIARERVKLVKQLENDPHCSDLLQDLTLAVPKEKRPPLQKKIRQSGGKPDRIVIAAVIEAVARHSLQFS